MSPIIGNIVSIVGGPDIGASVVEIYDRVTEDGLYRRKIETGLDDRETEAA